MPSLKGYARAPVALTATTTTNLINPGTTTGGTGTTAAPNDKLLVIITHIRVANTTNATKSFALWKGATGANTAGTEFYAAGTATAGALDANTGVSVPANSFVDFYPGAPGNLFTTSDFLVGGASATGLTLTAEGYIGVA
jgi:hypothetical protein